MIPGEGMDRKTSRLWLKAFWPATVRVDWHERVRVVVGAALGIGLAAISGHWLAGRWDFAQAWLVAPLGASAVLVFGLPASPLAQPWSVLAGNTLSALFGIACVHWFGHDELSTAVAVSGAIAMMLWLRCLHPPGGAAALLVAQLGISDWHFAMFPVLLNSAILVLAGLVYNNLTGRSYPHIPMAPPEPSFDTLNVELDAVLSRHNQIIDISREDLRTLLEEFDQEVRLHHPKD